MTTSKKITAVILAVIIAVFAFLGGFFTHKLTLNKSVSSYDWAIKTIDENYVGEYTQTGSIVLPVGNYTKEELSLKALAGKLDRYSAYYTSAEYNAAQNDNAGNKSGIGISYNFIEDEGALLYSVMGNSPAYKAGLRAGELLVSGTADGVTTEFMKANETSEFFNARAAGEEFTVSTQTAEYTLRKEEYTASYAHMFTNNTEWGFEGDNGENLKLYTRLSDDLDYLPDGTAYIRLTQFYGGIDKEFVTLVNQFNARNLKSMIIDLRNNGGGYLSSMQGIAGCFSSAVQSGKSVATTAKYKKGSSDFYCYKYSGDDIVPQNTKVYVLANCNTASASEALIGVLVSYGFLDYGSIYLSELSREYFDWAGITSEAGRAPRSYGKGIMQSTFVNKPTGEALKLTTAKIYWPNGKCIHGEGLTLADGCKSVKTPWVVTKGDTELQSVVQMIKSSLN